ncbi:polysaccharide biosynthesis/export protein [Paraburkholderia kururiensis]
MRGASRIGLRSKRAPDAGNFPFERGFSMPAVAGSGEHFVGTGAPGDYRKSDMSRKNRIIACLVSGAVAGCSAVPGPYLDPSRMQKEPEASTEKPVYPVHMIDAGVIAQQIKFDESNTQALPQEVARQGDYRVGAGDVLNIIVWGHPELTVNGGATAATPGNVTDPNALNGPTGAGNPGALVDPNGERVSADGAIYFPTVGRVHVAGMTAGEIAATLRTRLGSYAVKPQLDVRVAQFRSQQVQLAGDLKNPGTMPITDVKMTVVDAIARAGGAQPDADLQRVQLTRDGKVYTLDVQRTLDRGDVSQNIVLRAGDILYVPDHNASRVFVLGEVTKPQTLFMNKGKLTLADAIADVNSIDPRAAQPRQILVIRRTPNDPRKPTIYQLDMTQVDAILLSTEFELQPLDVVYVGTAEVARFNRLLEQLLPTMTSLYLIYSVGK